MSGEARRSPFAPAPSDGTCGRSFRSGSGRYYDCGRHEGHDGGHSAFADRPPASAPAAPDNAGLPDALRIHHPIMRSETGPFSGCRCGAVKLGQDVIAHVVAELFAALLAERDDLAAKVAAVRELADEAVRIAMTPNTHVTVSALRSALGSTP